MVLTLYDVQQIPMQFKKAALLVIMAKSIDVVAAYYLSFQYRNKVFCTALLAYILAVITYVRTDFSETDWILMLLFSVLGSWLSPIAHWAKKNLNITID